MGGIGTSSTGTIKLTGGTWSGAGTISCNLTFAGNVTVSGTVSWNTATLTYTSGTITTTSSTMNVTASATFNTNGISWNNITGANSGALVWTINSLLTVTGTLASATSGTLTFAGTSGWTVGTLSIGSAVTATFTFQHGVTYTITTSLQCFSSRVGSIVLFTSDDGTATAAIVLQAGAICSVLANFTRIDATGGRTINTFHGTLTTTTNIFSYTDYGVGGGSSCLFCN
jgi:hypothetical protein